MLTKSSFFPIILIIFASIAVSLVAAAVTSEAEENQFTCSPDDFRFTSVEHSNAWFYTSTSREIVFWGCFPRTNLQQYNYYAQFIDPDSPSTPIPVTIYAIGDTYLGIRTPILPTAYQKLSLQLCHDDEAKTPTMVNPNAASCVTFATSFSATLPTFTHVTPFSIPLAPGESDVRIVVSGFRSQSTLTVRFDQYVIPIVSRQDNYLILRLPIDFPTDIKASKFYDISFTDFDHGEEPVLIVPQGLSIYHPSNTYNSYITSMSPSWLTLRPLDEASTLRTVTINGKGLGKARVFQTRHPFSKELVQFTIGATADNDAQNDQNNVDNGRAPLNLISDNKLIFGLPSFSWYDATLFPRWNQTKYADVTVADGPVWFELIDQTGSTIVSSEFTFLTPPSTTHQITIPSAAVPINYAVEPFDLEPGNRSTRIVMSLTNLDKIPVTVPFSIRFGDFWTLKPIVGGQPDSAKKHRRQQRRFNEPPQAQEGSQSDFWSVAEPNPYIDPRSLTNDYIKVHFFHANGSSLNFTLPPCPTCQTPQLAQLCLTADDGTCLHSLGQMTYLAPKEPREPTITQAVSNSAYFDDFENSLSVFHYGLDPKALESVRLSSYLESAHNSPMIQLGYKHSKTGFLLPIKAWSQTGPQALSTALPSECLVPKGCPEGVYVPVIVNDGELADLVYVQHGLEITAEQPAAINLILNPGNATQIGISTDYDFMDQQQRDGATAAVVNALELIYGRSGKTKPSMYLKLEPIKGAKIRDEMENFQQDEPSGEKMSAMPCIRTPKLAQLHQSTHHSSSPTSPTSSDRVDTVPQGETETKTEDKDKDQDKSKVELEVDADQMKTVINLIIRPKATDAQLSSIEVAEMITADLKDPNSSLRKALPQLSSDPAVTKTVRFCAKTGVYQEEECKEEEKVKNDWAKRALIIFVVFAVLGVIGYVVWAKTTLCAAFKKPQQGEEFDDLLGASVNDGSEAI